jgi:transmembrane sensor
MVMFEKYAGYSVEDFVKDEKFITWVKLSDAEGDLFWSEFLQYYPHQQETITHARQVVAHLGEASRMPVDRHEVSEIWSNLATALEDEGKDNGRILVFNWKKWVAAASVIFVLGGLIWWVQVSKDNQPQTYARLIAQVNTPLKEIINTTSKAMDVTLPDGSVVTLEKASRLSYVPDFKGDQREVFLLGAAFFNVTENPKKPFVVYANELVTRVLGTSFAINAFEQNKQLTIAVRTGRVAVFKNKDFKHSSSGQPGVVLIPNQQAAFTRESEKLVRSLVAKPQVLVSDKELEDLKFTNAPLEEIFKALEKAYGVEIVFDRALLSNCRLTTSLGNETLFERLDIICEASEASYKVVDTKVIIDSKNCN